MMVILSVIEASFFGLKASYSEIRQNAMPKQSDIQYHVNDVHVHVHVA
jgi:hypothetical protein